MVPNNILYPPENYSPLTISGGGFTEFGELFGLLRKRWVKVEFLQYYDEGDSEAFEAFLRGDFDLAAQRVAEDVKSQTVYDVARQHDVSMIRVRVYRLPLTNYLSKFEYHAYIADEKMGETILTVNWSSAEDLIASTGVSDFLLYDDWGVVTLLYDEPTGRVHEARLVTEVSEVSAYVDITEHLINIAQPLRHSEFTETVKLSR